jgi:rubredoxin
MNLESKITCPECGFAKTEEMPTNACIHFYECENCGVRLKPSQEIVACSVRMAA